MINNDPTKKEIDSPRKKGNDSPRKMNYISKNLSIKIKILGMTICLSNCELEIY